MDTTQNITGTAGVSGRRGQPAHGCVAAPAVANLSGTLASMLLIVLVALGISGCGGGSSPPPPGFPPVINSFAASPTWITSGKTATLKWSVTGATSLSIDALGPVTGTSTQTTPNADASYVLTATNQYGSTQAQTTVAVFPPPAVWFAPIGATRAIPVQGASDYFDLFSTNAAWLNAASHVAVFKMYSQMLDLDDATLRNVFADLKRRHIAFAIEWGPLAPSGGCGAGIEGFTGEAALHYAQRIRDLGGSLQYIAFDEPFDGAVLYGGTNACHWTPMQTAQNAAQNVAQVQAVFPDVVVGDIEVVPNAGAVDTWLSGYGQWLDAWQAVTGKPLAFLHFDMDWANGSWEPAAVALTRALAKRNIPVGHIYDGNGQTSDVAWIAAAEQHMTDIETHGRLVADQAIFQSWEAYPKHLLPETDPTAFTYLINRYFRNRTTLDLSASSAGGGGTLNTKSGPLGNATIALTTLPLSGTGQPSAYTQAGTAPPGAQYVVFGARVALENCNGVALPAEFFLSDFTLNAGPAGQLHADFTNQLNGWGIWGNAAIAQVEQANLHLQVLPGQTMGLNSGSLPFAAGGAAYTLTVNAMIPLGSRGNGCTIAVFQDANFNELTRASIQIVPQSVGLGTVQTDGSGAYTFGLVPQPAPFELWADYGGSATLWPASASTPIGPVPALAITTTSLLDGAVAGAYAQTLAATGGRSPYLWVGAGVPPGLVLGQDGTLSGTPTAAGTYTVSLSVVDDSAPAQVVDTSFVLVIH